MNEYKVTLHQTLLDHEIQVKGRYGWQYSGRSCYDVSMYQVSLL